MKIIIESIKGIGSEVEMPKDSPTLLYNPDEANPFMAIYNEPDRIYVVLNPWKIEKYKKVIEESKYKERVNL